MLELKEEGRTPAIALTGETIHLGIHLGTGTINLWLTPQLTITWAPADVVIDFQLSLVSFHPNFEEP